MAHTDHTTAIQGCIDRLRAGDESARAALLGCAADGLARLARKMLKGYPGVARWEQGDDVAQNAIIRLDRALRAVTPPTARDFFRLAAVEVRRELIDLARHYQGPRGLGAHHATPADRGGSAAGVAMAAGRAENDQRPGGRLAAWAEFHAACVAAAGLGRSRALRPTVVPGPDPSKGGRPPRRHRTDRHQPLAGGAGPAGRLPRRPAPHLTARSRR